MEQEREAGKVDTLQVNLAKQSYKWNHQNGP